MADIFDSIKIAIERTAVTWSGTGEWYMLRLGRDVKGWFYATDVLKNGKYKGFQVTWWDDKRVPDKAKQTSWDFRDLRGRTVAESEVPPKVVARVQARNPVVAPAPARKG